MAAKHTLSEALKTIRKARGLSQEAFSDVSSRTYMSTLERDLKSPTLNKLAELCEVMEVHPLTLLTLAYAGDSPQKADELLAQVRQELEAERDLVFALAQLQLRGTFGSYDQADGVVSASGLTEFNEEQEHRMTAAEAATCHPARRTSTEARRVAKPIGSGRRTRGGRARGGLSHCRCRRSTGPRGASYPRRPGARRRAGPSR